MIQILTYSGKEDYFQGKDAVVSKIHDARSLDEFDINIISLEDKNLWCNIGQTTDRINDMDDLKSLSIMIDRSKKTKIVILFPQNRNFLYHRYQKDYLHYEELKNMISNLCSIIAVLHRSIYSIDLVYENTITKIENENIASSFYFEISESENILLKSDKSKKPTVIECGGIILSTLLLKNYEQIVCFLKEIGLVHDKQDIPAWMEEVKMFDDIQQFRIIEENNQAIKKANDNISNAMEKINKNNEYKSILYTFGDELVKIVFEILENMLGCDLSQFEDKKNEDFLFEAGGCVFIGEIKGVNHNVKNENVAQLDRHYQGYLDEHEDANEESIKAILIMNHQKNKAVNAREPVHEKQVNLAKRNGSLIVETITLLRLFEKYLNGNVSREACLNLFKTEEGLLQI